MPNIATLATNQSLHDLKIFLKSLALWYTLESCPTVYLFTDTETMKTIQGEFPSMRIIYKNCLDKYSSMTRKEMEQAPRGTKTLWYEFQMEKMNLLDWALATDPQPVPSSTNMLTTLSEGGQSTSMVLGHQSSYRNPNSESSDYPYRAVFYLDSDICFFAPLPEVPDGFTVGVSPHFIALKDEAKFGKYNGGYLWVKDPKAVTAWRNACPASRFHEQAALEIFDTPEWSKKVYQFPIQYNYGWWRLWQGRESPDVIERSWDINIVSKDDVYSGLLVDGKPLGSVHTHFYNPSDSYTKFFNVFVVNFLKRIKWHHPKANELLKIIESV